MDRVANVDKFNKFVEKVISKNGTCEMVEQDSERIACYEADCYRADNSIDGFVGWWADDTSQMTYAVTPYQVYCDMPEKTNV